MARVVAAYGSWVSPISSELAAAGSLRLSSPQIDGPDRYWLEGRPQEGGRVVLVRRRPDGTAADVTPPSFSVRSRVHEYGGGAYLVAGGRVYFSNHRDQRLWLQAPGSDPVPLTGQPAEGTSVRYADARLVADQEWLVCVRETHTPGPGGPIVDNEIVAVPIRPGQARPGRGPAERTLVSGHDFFSYPRISPDGQRLAWTCWDHPDMPWDASELWLGDLASQPDGAPAVSAARRVAGGPGQSVFQPEWSPDGRLHVVCDRTGWWNLYRVEDGQGPKETAALVPLAPMASEWGRPQWVFGMSTYGFLADGTIVAAWSDRGSDTLGILDGTGEPRSLGLPFTDIGQVTTGASTVVAVVAGPRIPAQVVEVPMTTGRATGGAIGPPSTSAGPPLVLARSLDLSQVSGLAAADISEPEELEYPTWGGQTAFAHYYRPASATMEGPEHERPPLVVVSHGGPTGSASSAFDLSRQYWTSRGFAVVDVDYAGSTGYGRSYRQRLRGRWGVADVDDCVNAAAFLVDQDQVDPNRLAIRGASAGGFTALCAVTFRDRFKAAASYYGVADAASLAADTHKFESRYMDGLIGPWPEAQEGYRARSPIHHAEPITAALIIFQGLDDPVVPPSQAEAMVDALRRRGLPHAYLSFEGEQHGFRRATTLARCLEAELSFYASVLGFDPADPGAPGPQ